MFTKNGIIFDHIYPRIKGSIIKSPELNKLYNFFKGVEILPFEEISSSFSEEKFKNEYELSYASKNIKDKIEKYNLKYTYVLKFTNNIITLNLFSDKKISSSNFLPELKKYIQYILSIHPVKTDITINYHLSDEKKFIKKGILTKNEVNSGSCMMNGQNSIINIWRKEEILKVTLHEIFHSLGHANYTDSNEIIKDYERKYNIKLSKLNTHEAYTEIWANLINCFLISQKYNNPKTAFNTLVTIEKYYSIFQAKKVMHNVLTKKSVDIDKGTNVTAYFLIRAELYQRLNAFLKFCRLENTNYMKIKNTNKWLVFLQSKNKVRRNDKIFKGNRGYLFKNLRMTILELDVIH